MSKHDQVPQGSEPRPRGRGKLRTQTVDLTSPPTGVGGPDALAFSRRGFLKGASALVAAPLIGSAAVRAADPPKDGLQRSGPGAVPIELTINGKSHKVEVEPRVTLLDVLRDKLDLTGAKEVCARGACGACTVLIDDKPVNSCLMLAMDAVGAKVTTIEGLADGDKLDPVQAAFAKYDALQCGYCTPGFVMSVKSLLARNPKPTVEDVRKGCAGNICRCGTYTKIFEAALAAAGVAVPLGNEADNAGKAMENTAGRADAVLKVTGRAKYTADVNLPKMAYAAIVYCPYGKANLKSVDVEAAQKVPGVLDVEIREKREFKYCGHPAGHVCAENRQALDDALAALSMKWEVLEPATDPIKEHQNQQGPIPPALDKAGSEEEVAKAAEAFKSAKRVVEHTYQTQIQTHSCLEPHCAVADYRGDSAEMWVSSQATSGIFQGAVQAFNLDRNKVRTHCEFVGGGFGSKFDIDAEGHLAAHLSKKLARPIKVVNDRKREHLDTGCRPGSIQYMKLALAENGLPAGGHVHIAGVCGASTRADAANPSRYELGKPLKSSAGIKLSVGDARAMRAPGHPQGMFAVDSFVDELAAAAGVDPLEYRLKIDPSPVRKLMYSVGAERIGWTGRPQPDGSGHGRLRRGIGIGVGSWGNGKAPAQIRIDVFRDGTLRVFSGTQDIGTGTRTVLIDTVASHLGIDRKLITADCGNSDYPQGPGSGGSTVTRAIVPAIRDAAEKARAKLIDLAAGDAKIADTPAWTAACKKIAGESFTVLGEPNDKYWGKGGSDTVQFAEVEVDTGTGVVRALKVVALQSCGKPVNRLLAESQIIGGVIQGVSFALYEEKILDPQTGVMTNPNLETYKICGPVDCPDVIPILWKEEEADLGARSLGEPPVIPTAGAIANAVSNAIGARVRSLPITPYKVLAALAERRSA
ncbi:MAG TPA: molybdopterin-dependent oxidoreductase [Phycisphaerae bacterium]